MALGRRTKQLTVRAGIAALVVVAFTLPTGTAQAESVPDAPAPRRSQLSDPPPQGSSCLGDNGGVTERKPWGVSVETWVDKQIREAQERGEFDDLPGAGKPIPGRGQPDDELWWLKQYMTREQLTMTLPASLQIRKEVEDIQTRLAKERQESQVRRIVEDLNDRIRHEIRHPGEGPPVRLGPLDVDTVVQAWRERRAR